MTLTWIGVATTVFGLVVGCSPVRHWVRGRWPWVRDGHLEAAAAVLVLLGCATTVASALQDQTEKAELRGKVEAIRTAIREVRAEVTVEFTASWANGQGSTGLLVTPGLGADRVWLVLGDGSTVALQEVGAATMDRMDDGATRFRYEVETTPGSTLVGRSFEDFEAISAIQVVPLVSVPDSKTTDGALLVRSIEVSLRANERRYLVRRASSPPFRVPAEDHLLRIDLRPGELASSLAQALK